MRTTTRSRRPLAALAAASLLAVGGLAPTAFARHGADDPAGHDARDDHGGRVVKARTARHGADDRAGHRHHRHHGADDRAGHHRHGGADDGPNHT
jgi:hypothetical protein